MRTRPQARIGEAAPQTMRGARLVEYDRERRRVWVCGQRLHHGLTGALLTAAGLGGLAARQISPRGSLEWTLVGSLLMAHDWNDRGQWFEAGRQAD